MATSVPALALSNALLFADPTFECLSGLGQEPDRWQDAVVLSTPFWLPRIGKLNSPLSFAEGISPLAAASIRFDPDRELTATTSGLGNDGVSSDLLTKTALATAKRVRVLSSFPSAALPALFQLMPSLAAVHLATAKQLVNGSTALASLEGLRELHVTNCNDLSDLSALASLTALHALHLGGCFNLEDVSALASLTSLRELSLRCCSKSIGRHVLPPSMSADVEFTDQNPWGDSPKPSLDTPVDLLGIYAGFLVSDDVDESNQGVENIHNLLSHRVHLAIHIGEILCDAFSRLLQIAHAWDARRDAGNNLVEESTFVLSFVELATFTMNKLLQQANNGAPEAASLLDRSFPFAVELLAISNLDVKETALSWFSGFIRSTIINEDEAATLLNALFPQLAIPADDTDDPNGDLLDHRSRIAKTIQLLYRRFKEVVLHHCLSTVMKITSDGELEGDFSTEFVEGALWYAHDLVKNMGTELRRDPSQPPHPATQMVQLLLQATAMRESHSGNVHLAYFQLMERAAPHLDDQEAGALLDKLIAKPWGITNPDPKVRSSICFIFIQVVRPLRSQFAAKSQTYVPALMKILNSTDGLLTNSDKMKIFEALGTLLTSCDISYCRSIIEDAVSQTRSIRESVNVNVDEAASAAAEQVSFLSSFAKGWSTNNDTVESDSTQKLDPFSDVLVQASDAVIQVVDGFHDSQQVRDSALLFSHQLVNVLEGVDSQHFVSTLVSKLLGPTNVVELPKVLRLVHQFICKNRQNSADFLKGSLFPLIVDTVQNVCPFQRLKIDPTHMTREEGEAMKRYIELVHATVHSSAIAAIEGENRKPELSLMLSQLSAALRVAPDTCEIARPTVQILTRLASLWLTTDGGSGFEEYLRNDGIPKLLDAFTGPQTHHSDVKTFTLVADSCKLLQSVIEALGGRGQGFVVSLLTAESTVGMPNDEAIHFCTDLQRAPRVSMGLKTTFKSALEAAQRRRKASN